MNKFLILLLFMVSLVALSNQQSCGPNQVYQTCGPICRPSCDFPRHMICPKVCVRGCFCVPGYVSTSHMSRECIPPYLCPT
ncbi:chymotrypsin inhibitor [Cephus cinctus]|uniref:Chymotrypsin inhibitor n=1 Tax=Cephus cinctus TaxID=211228 RepID=A0AAJ7BWR7_CEPCN|nr:chymotrypsin inhibitor [Cephus cinctus]